MFNILPGKSPATVNVMRTVCMIWIWPGSQWEWTGMCMCEQWQRHCTSQSEGVVDAVEWACVLCGHLN